MSHLWFCPARECKHIKCNALSYDEHYLSASYLVSNLLHCKVRNQGRSLIGVSFGVVYCTTPVAVDIGGECLFSRRSPVCLTLFKAV